MKVLFSNPPWWEAPQGPFWRRRWRAGVRGGSRWPFTYEARSRPDHFRPREYLPYPFFMGYAATYAARATGAAVTLRDSIALRESYESFYRHIEQSRYDLVFFEIATPSWDNDRRVIEEVHRRSPGTRIAVAGPITTTKSAEILAQYPVQACIKGEYEKASVKVIGGASGTLEFDLMSEAEMNAAPFPYYDPVIAHRYWDENPKGQVWPHAQVWSSRGCPFKCIFCVWPAAMTGNDPDGSRARKVRHYSAGYMEAFLRELVDRYAFKSIYFDDDTFNLGNRHTVEMCEVMTRIGLPWTAMCRADSVKLDTWRMMRDAGCVGVKLGFESGNQYVVDKIVNKHLDLAYAADVVRELKRLGLSVHGTFTYGLPGETREQMLDTKRYIASLPFDTYQESGTAEIEGTPLHTLREKGSLAAYAGAQMDAGYSRAADGNKKFQQLVQQLQDN